MFLITEINQNGQWCDRGATLENLNGTKICPIFRMQARDGPRKPPDGGESDPRMMNLQASHQAALAAAQAAAKVMHAVNLLVSRQLVHDIGHYADRAAICVVPTLCPLEASSYDYSAAASLIDRAVVSTRAWIAAGGLQKTGAPSALHDHTH